MGLGGISIWQLLIILAIVVMIFGTKKLRNVGKDVGGAVKGFKDAVNEDPKKVEQNTEETSSTQQNSQEKNNADQ